jgi:hypothetical protein
MAKKESDWMRALREEVARTSQRRAAALLGVSATTIGLVLAGKYKSNPKTLAKRVRGKVMSKPRRTKQLRQVDRALHAEIKRLVELWGAEFVGRWFNTPPQELLAHVRGTSRIAPAEFIGRVAALGLPKAQPCRHCGVPEAAGAVS